MKQDTRFAIITMTIASIQACCISLNAQLVEYDFLEVTPEQQEKLEQIYQDMHKVFKEITED